MSCEAKGLKHAASAMAATLDGIAACFRREMAFRQEIVFGIVNFIAAIILAKTLTETFILVIVYMLLPLVELLNSAIEEIVDMFSPNFSEYAKRAKDYAAAATFLAVVIVIGTWSCVLYRRFFSA